MKYYAKHSISAYNLEKNKMGIKKSPTKVEDFLNMSDFQ